MIKLITFTLMFIHIGHRLAVAEAKPTPVTVRAIQPAARVFIAPMEGQLDGFLAPEIIKRKLPITIVMDEKDADFILVGASLKSDDHWFNTVFGGKDKNEGNVRILNPKTKELVWAGEAGDRSLWWGSLKRGGQRKVAERIVKQMRKDIFSK